MTFGTILRRVGWGKFFFLGLSLPIYSGVVLWLSSRGWHPGITAAYFFCAAAVWLVVVLRSMADPPAEVWEIILLLVLSLLGPIGLLVIAVCLIRS